MRQIDALNALNSKPDAAQGRRLKIKWHGANRHAKKCIASQPPAQPECEEGGVMLGANLRKNPLDTERTRLFRRFSFRVYVPRELVIQRLESLLIRVSVEHDRIDLVEKVLAKSPLGDLYKVLLESPLLGFKKLA